MSLKNICTTYVEYLRVNISTFSTFFNIIYYKTTNDRLLWDIPAVVVVVGNPLGACSVSRAKEFRNFLQQQQTMEKCSGNNYNRKWRGGGRGGVDGGFFGTVFWTIAELEKLLTELRSTQLLPCCCCFCCWREPEDISDLLADRENKDEGGRRRWFRWCLHV